jgi:hypothetical protein
MKSDGEEVRLVMGEGIILKYTLIINKYLCSVEDLSCMDLNTHAQVYCVYV